MLCDVMLCYGMVCYAMLLYVMLFHVTSCHATSCYVASRDVKYGHAVLRSGPQSEKTDVRLRGPEVDDLQPRCSG